MSELQVPVQFNEPYLHLSFSPKKSPELMAQGYAGSIGYLLNIHKGDIKIQDGIGWNGQVAGASIRHS